MQSPQNSRRRRIIAFDGDNPVTEVCAALRRALLTPDAARNRADYELLDAYVHAVSHFADVPPDDRLRYLRAGKGIEIERGEALFNIGDAADAFYCVMYGSLNVVLDFARMAAPTLSDFEDINNRARVHESLLNPGGTGEILQDANYVVRTLKALECFGDVGLLLSDQHRTASVVACERTLLMKIDRETFLELRSSNISRELREKIKFLSCVRGFEQWDSESTLKLCGRLEKVTFGYNDIVVSEDEPSNYFHFVKHGECRLVKRFQLRKHTRKVSFVEICTVGSRHYFGSFEVLRGEPNASFSVLVSSPTAILYRLDRVDFRQIALKDPLIESLLRTETLGLAARIDEASVRQDLAVDAKWGRYRRELAAEVLAKHEQEHALTCFGQRSPDKNSHIRSVRRPLPAISSSNTSASGVPSPRSSSNNAASSISMGPPMSPPPGARSTKNAYSRRPSILVTTPTRSQQPVRSKKWLEWAKARATEIVTSHDGERINLPTDEARQHSSATKSHIQWSKTSKILGGLVDEDEDKVASAIVSLFSRVDDAKRR